MTAPIPSDFWGRIRQMIVEEVAKFFRSGPLRNASISDGGLTIRGGFFRVIGGVANLFYVGPYGPAAGDGTVQQGMTVRRFDGTAALSLYDAFPGATGEDFDQALTWHDREGNAVVADDTNSGQGLARPYIPGALYPARFADYLSTTAGTFETIYRAELPKQHPRLRVAVYAATDTAGTTGQIRCLVEGDQFGAQFDVDNSVQTTCVWGPEFLPDAAHMSTVHIEVQARRTGGAGQVRIAPISAQGMQS